MQSARAYNSILSTPPVKHQPNKEMEDASTCTSYWLFEANPKPFDKYDLYEHDDEVDAIQLKKNVNLMKMVHLRQSNEKDITTFYLPLHYLNF